MVKWLRLISTGISLASLCTATISSTCIACVSGLAKKFSRCCRWRSRSFMTPGSAIRPPRPNQLLTTVSVELRCLLIGGNNLPRPIDHAAWHRGQLRARLDTLASAHSGRFALTSGRGVHRDTSFLRCKHSPRQNKNYMTLYYACSSGCNRSNQRLRRYTCAPVTDTRRGGRKVAKNEGADSSLYGNAA